MRTTIKTVALIGHPVAHSISPHFQQAAFDALALPFRYEAWDTPPEQLPASVAQLRHPDHAGANVTVPHKEAIASLLDRVDEAARATGAVNVIYREGGALAGSNTDIAGFSQALRLEGGLDVRGARAGVLGAGGAARAVVYALLRDGAARVWVHNRTPARAAALVAALSPNERRVAVTSGDPGDPRSPLQHCDVLINCTTLGMAHGPGALDAYLRESQIPTGIVVCDLVANPTRTPLLARAEARGCRTLGGLPMLVRQGAAAFTFWTGREAPLDVMFAAARQAMGQEP